MRTLSTFIFSLLCLVGVDRCRATEGDPVAIMRLPGGGIAIETMWNLSVVITDATADLNSKLAGLDILIGDAVNQQTEDGQLTDQGPRFVVAASASLDHRLDRPANQAKATFEPHADGDPSSNAIRIRTVSTATLVTVDGVRIVYLKRPPTPPLDSDQVKLLNGCDALIVKDDTMTAEQAQTLAASIDAKRLVFDSKATTDTEVVSGNTLAISTRQQPQTLQRLSLGNKPVPLLEELTALIERKEQACEASQQTFAGLSVPQMNFRPGNGSHTPRWNAEHMMGRELLFFSQIYHAQDDAIAVMDLNPKQMPPDYVAKHPGWSGTEEAMQMERVSAFTRRFAYLLKDLPLDRKAPGSGWTPRALLLQMERHYNDHTANVKQKFELPDWPRQ